MLNIHLEDGGEKYYSINPTETEVYNILKDVTTFKTHISKLTQVLREHRLLRFPESIKTMPVVIEFSDCIIQARDLMSYHIILDEDNDRAEFLKGLMEQQRNVFTLNGT